MAKEEEDIIARIRPGEYVEELEQKVKIVMEEIMSKPLPPKVTKKYGPSEIPEFGTDIRTRREWEQREIYKCMNGDGDIPGTYYFYLNHTKIKNKERGKIRPDFRQMDLEWFKFFESVEKTPGKGIVCIKRRQIGMSWKASVIGLHHAQFKRDFDIGMSSKGIKDSQDLLEKIKYLYRNQSNHLRVATSTDRRDKMLFATYDKDEYGNRGKLISGTESSIIVVAPTVNGHAGSQYKLLVLDEAGETENIEGIWANAEDCLMQETMRYGCPVIFGTTGNSETTGGGLHEFWKNHKTYDLEQFPFWGYNSLLMDEYGNDDIEDSVRWIIYKRRKKEAGSATVYNKFIQKYPLNEDDAFLSSATYGVGNPITINKQINNLLADPQEARKGLMKLVGEDPVFEPNPNGHAVMYELPRTDVKDFATACLDPAEDDNVKKTKDSSDLGFSIVGRPFGLLPQRLLYEYCHRPQKLEEAYIQIALACKIYNVKLHIEMNKGGWRAYDWFVANYPELLALPPVAANSIKNGVESKYGLRMTVTSKMQMEGLLNQHLDNTCLPDESIGWKGIKSKRFLEQCKVFGGKGKDDDLAVSVGWNLIVQQGDNKVAKTLSAQEEIHTRPHFSVKNGILIRVNQKNERIQQVRNRNIPRSIFGR